MQDQRHDPRIPLIAAAEVTEVATGTRLSARTSDISRSGCYIDSLNPTAVKKSNFPRALSMSAQAWAWAFASTKICLLHKRPFSIAGSPAQSKASWLKDFYFYTYHRWLKFAALLIWRYHLCSSHAPIGYSHPPRSVALGNPRCAFCRTFRGCPG